MTLPLSGLVRATTTFFYRFSDNRAARQHFVKNFRYSLSSARHWRSFGGLELTVDAGAPDIVLQSNTGASQITTGQVRTWQFTQLPADYLDIKATHAIAALPRALIAINPFRLMVLCGVLAAALHAWAMKSYRKRFPTRKYSPVLIIGSIVLPFGVLLSCGGWYMLIDRLIGSEAGHGHGYSFLIVFLYPVAMPLYWLLMWIADRAFRKMCSSGNR